jgi:hypothetical protein
MAESPAISGMLRIHEAIYNNKRDERKAAVQKKMVWVRVNEVKVILFYNENLSAIPLNFFPIP